MKFIVRLRNLSPNVWTLGLVSLFADISSELLYPIIPLFLTGVVGAPVAVLGVIEGFAEATASWLKTWSGQISDLTRKRKPLIFSGYFISAIAKPLMGLSTTWILLFFSRFLDRVGKGLRGAPRDALIADSTPPSDRGLAFGFHRGMDSLGAVIGPLLAILLLAHYKDDLRMPFYWAFIPGVLSALFVFRARESPTQPRPQRASEKIGIKNFNRLPVKLRYFFAAWLIFALVNSCDMFLLLKVKEMGFTMTEVVLVYALYNFVYATSSPYLGHLSDRLPRSSLLIFGFVIFGFVYIALTQQLSSLQVVMVFMTYGFYTAATDGVSKAFITDLVSDAERGTALGLFGTLQGIGALVASSVAGLLWTLYGSSAALLYGAVGAWIAAILLFATQRRRSVRSKTA